jgi:hypothetical protein
MQCPYCGTELELHDYYGNYYNGGIYKIGDIYKCPNVENGEPCESAVFNGLFYTDLQDNLYEGYPC